MMKITNKAALIYVVDHCDLPTEVSGKLYAMIDALERKSKSASTSPKKPTPVQVKNVEYMNDIMTFLAANPEQGFRCAEIAKNVASLAEIGASTSKVSALMGKLVVSGKVTRYELKRAAYFKAVTE